MIPDTLYDLAMEYRKTKLWKKLYDMDLFAVRFRDGEIGYCCVMGMMDEHLALGVYVGEAGFASFRRLCADRSRMRECDARETAFSQDCLMVSFEGKEELRERELEEARAYARAHGTAFRGKNAYPKFERFRPHYYPWYLNDATDQAHMAEALEAALAVSERLTCAMPETTGFSGESPLSAPIPLLEKKDGAFVWSETQAPKAKPVRYSKPDLQDDLMLKKLMRSKKRCGEWAMDVFLHAQPMADGDSENGMVEEPEHAPFYPYLLLIVDNQSGMVVHVELAANADEYAEYFVRVVADVMLKIGKPERILVMNARACALATKLAERVGVELAMQTRLPFLEEAEQDFLDRMSGEEDISDDVLEELDDILRDPDALAELPEEMFLQLARLVELGALSEPLMQNVQNERKRRGV